MKKFLFFSIQSEFLFMHIYVSLLRINDHSVEMIFLSCHFLYSSIYGRIWYFYQTIDKILLPPVNQMGLINFYFIFLSFGTDWELSFIAGFEREKNQKIKLSETFFILLYSFCYRWVFNIHECWWKNNGNENEVGWGDLQVE